MGEKAPTWVLSSVLKGVLGEDGPSDAQTTQAQAPRGKAFIASPRFSGSRPGYMFSLGAQGLG
jgi:hypothetical protein